MLVDGSMQGAGEHDQQERYPFHEFTLNNSRRRCNTAGQEYAPFGHAGMA
jgi:hypothetical protein